MRFGRFKHFVVPACALAWSVAKQTPHPQRTVWYIPLSGLEPSASDNQKPTPCERDLDSRRVAFCVTSSADLGLHRQDRSPPFESG